MRYVNCGAADRADILFPTKKALREAVKLDPEGVRLFQTAAFMASVDDTILAADIPAGETWNVCGPDPYNKRRWFASVQRAASGRVVVK